MITTEQWIAQLTGRTGLGPEVCKTLWDAFVSTVVKRTVQGQTTDTPPIGRWATCASDAFVATLPQSERFLVPPRITPVLEFSTAPAWSSEVITTLSALSVCDAPSVEIFHTAVEQLFLYHQKKRYTLSWEHLGTFSDHEGAYAFTPSEEFCKQVNKPFDAFTPTALHEGMEWPDLAVVACATKTEFFPHTVSLRLPLQPEAELETNVPPLTIEPMAEAADASSKKELGAAGNDAEETGEKRGVTKAEADRALVESSHAVGKVDSELAITEESQAVTQTMPETKAEPNTGNESTTETTASILAETEKKREHHARSQADRRQGVEEGSSSSASASSTDAAQRVVSEGVGHKPQEGSFSSTSASSTDAAPKMAPERTQRKKKAAMPFHLKLVLVMLLLGLLTALPFLFVLLRNHVL